MGQNVNSTNNVWEWVIHSGERGGNTYRQDVETAQIKSRILYKMKSVRLDKIVRTNLSQRVASEQSMVGDKEWWPLSLKLKA